MQSLSIITKSKVEFTDITPELQQAVKESKVTSGILIVYIPHTTAGITINEHADADVIKDTTSALEALVPQDQDYSHAEGNSPAHIKSSLVGASQAIIIKDGRLLLGTWQGIFFCEFDGPRNRKVFIKILADGQS